MGKTKIPDEKINLKEGERRFVTVLFTDMKNFTNLSSRLDPEELHQLMNKVFSIFESIVKKFDGTIEKYIGDALVAIFGAKKIHEDDPSRAINCALEMLDSINDINESLRESNIELKFRTGINSGVVTVGKRGEFDVVTGDTLAIASRLQEAAEENSILVSETTKEESDYDFIFSQPIELTLKGVSGKITAYKVLGYNYTFFNYNTPFIGREQHINKILKKYIKFNGDKIDGFYITGEQGSGKTRIVAEFYKKLKEFPDYNGAFLIAKAGSFPFFKFGVISNLILNYLKLSKYDSKEKITKTLSDKLSIDDEQIITQFLYLIDPELYEDIRVNSSFEFLKENKKNKNIKNSDLIIKQQEKIDPYIVLLKIIEKIFQKHQSQIYFPIIFIDSVDQIDKESRDFLRYFFDKSAIKPFFLISSDIIDQNVLSLFLGIEELQIPPLNEDEAFNYIKSLLKVDISDDDIKIIVERTKGNPLFIEEYIKFINKTGNINQVPTTIQNLVLSLFDKYSQDIKDLLYKCSVFRHSFKIEYLEYIYNKIGEKFDNLKEKLDLLVKDKILIYEKEIYRFRQSLIKDILYNSLLTQNKRILHKLIANLLIENEKSSLSTILYHLINASEYEMAKDYLINHASSINIDYINYIDTILNNLENIDSESNFDLLDIKFTILFNNGRIEEANETLNKLLKIALLENKLKYFAITFHYMTVIYKTQSDFNNVCFYGKKAIYYYLKIKENDPELFKEYKSLFSNIVFFTATSLYLIDKKDEALSYVDMLDNNELSKQRFYSIYYFYEGEYDKGIKILEDILNKSIENAEDFNILFIIDELIDLLYEAGNFEKIISYTDKLKDRFPFNYRFLSKFYSYLGISLCYLKQSDKGLEYLKKAEYFVNQLKNDYLKARVYAFLSEGFFLINDIEKSLYYGKEGLIFAIKNKDHLQIYEFYLILASIYIKINNKENIKIYIKEAEFYKDYGFIFDLKYKALLLYMKYKYLETDKEKKENLIKEAYQNVMEKIKNIKNEETLKRLLKTRLHGEIIEEYEKNFSKINKN